MNATVMLAFGRSRSTARSNVLPDVPTVADFLPGFEVNAANSIGAPRNTPPEIIDKLN